MRDASKCWYNGYPKKERKTRKELTIADVQSMIYQGISAIDIISLALGMISFELFLKDDSKIQRTPLVTF